MYAVAGASGQLGRLVLAELVARAGAAQVVALARDPAKLQGAGVGAQVLGRVADYDKPETLAPALAGVERLLLISGNAVGARVSQHKAVIDAAVAAGVKLIAYTSILHADTSTIGLAEEHRQTEALLRASGVPFVLLRNGWYNENYTGALAPAIAHGAILGAAGEGRIASATRADYAAAAATALIGARGGEVYELAGDTAFTMAEFAAEVSRLAGKPVAYVNMTKADYAAALEGVGLPGFLAQMLADSSFESSKDQLFDASRTLSALIGRPTTPIGDTIAAALA
ncbi:NAD(P)H-binding protein [Novosphingobium sp. SG720]|uniref:NAD(P)H-binding protein n=1 Tax=Novosphingobium sp. SG720 TaxID=2586998 RepID=UPI001447F6D5|nr:NAD(P)H-binding protein [Novosphingobium sp. SG720]NKJ43442.1 NAD(P)H dehydrogenase (quinone) [Novosphingobium sp. SG720]